MDFMDIKYWIVILAVVIPGPNMDVKGENL
jgi:hypothetical protein